MPTSYITLFSQACTGLRNFNIFMVVLCTTRISIYNYFNFVLVMSTYCQPFCTNYSPALNPLNAELNPICYLLALLGVHHFLHVSRIRVKSLTLRLLMSYIYMERLFLMFLDHTQRRSTVGRTPLDE